MLGNEGAHRIASIWTSGNSWWCNDFQSRGSRRKTVRSLGKMGKRLRGKPSSVGEISEGGISRFVVTDAFFAGDDIIPAEHAKCRWRTSCPISGKILMGGRPRRSASRDRCRPAARNRLLAASTKTSWPRSAALRRCCAGPSFF